MPNKEDMQRAADQARAQFHSIRDMVAELIAADDERQDLEIDVDPERYEAAERAIHEDPLSVQVRSGWYSPGDPDKGGAAAEYEILLCTGGPAVRIIGDLDGYGAPETAMLQFQDWFVPWTEWRGEDNEAGEWNDPEPTLLAYARQFYFGEG